MSVIRYCDSATIGMPSRSPTHQGLLNAVSCRWSGRDVVAAGPTAGFAVLTYAAAA
ncbi:MAG: hypothetical protein U0531_20535 [Dehalococcoidia bacterium]